MRSKDAHGMTNTVNPDQEQSGLYLQCLPRSVCPKSKDSLWYDETIMRAHGIYAEPQLHSRLKGNDQEPIQSNSTSFPRHHAGKEPDSVFRRESSSPARVWGKT